MSRRWWSGPVEAFSLLSAVRMPAVGSVRGALPWAPLVGLVLGAAATAVAWAAGRAASPLVGAVLGIAVLAVATRGLHLDGLADTADGLGPLRGREKALAVMRAGDVGPFGVATLVLTLLLQVACLAQLLTLDGGWLALPVAAVTARVAMARTGLADVPIAEGSSLGSAVAGTVSRGWLAGVALLTLAAAAGAGLLVDPGTALVLAAAVAVGLGCSEGLLARAVDRLGGVNGDVMGAMGEAAATAALLTAALLLA
ncbi:adenosylcobinamide-GDP ribazoletransferase [Modestobacter roseus]|uniref:Adenosylcobinamide-GDP ribazoletransferase n=1 Tax=Modestobacter roseus TaxID=1181884 RepID=A0A562IY82_9ACTN|nr:adenosylcobinamide-GDP ribazoletransferase [Modestobacter roseus]MQA34803.1 cobalamin biosynthesis protein CobS [Modestobacter roseus]TWH75565.1 cobalamin-5'-phosphate synthase [Modestobacter roseus]